MATLRPDADRELLVRSLHHLIGKLHLLLAGTGKPTRQEMVLIEDISEWYRSTGRHIAKARRAGREPRSSTYS